METDDVFIVYFTKISISILHIADSFSQAPNGWIFTPRYVFCCTGQQGPLSRSSELDHPVHARLMHTLLSYTTNELLF